MKRFLISIALLFCMSALFISCNKEGGISSSSIVGTWSIVKNEHFDKDGNLSAVEYPDGNKNKIVFTESNFTIYENNSPIGTVSYQYDSSTKRIVFGMGVCWIVQKLTAKELVFIEDESTYQKGEYGWIVAYFERN